MQYDKIVTIKCIEHLRRCITVFIITIILLCMIAYICVYSLSFC